MEAAAAARVDVLGLSRDELAAALHRDLGLPPFRARQIMPWIFRRGARNFSVMTDIAADVRAKLTERYIVSRPECCTILRSEDGTRKFLFRMADGALVETVLIRQPTRWTLCVSSQVGCAIGCTFCRTGKMGLQRSLSTAEITGQVLGVRDFLAGPRPEEDAGLPEEFANVVFMGMGEPLHNLDNVIRAVCILNDPLGLNYSGRKITVSTSGLVPGIKKFGESTAAANIALSLNATTDEVRTRLMPVNKRWPIAALLEALQHYPLKKGRRITIEYVLLSGINDTLEDLHRLPRLLHKIPVKVNLIPYNGAPDAELRPPSEQHVLYWQERLLDAGINSTIRWSKGADIAAACGQLATAYKKRTGKHN